MDYDDANRLLNTTLPQVADGENDGEMTNPVVAQTYDKNGNVLTATDARGTVTTNVYDKLNRITSSTADSSGIAVEGTFTYDANSNKLTETLKRGDHDLVTTYEYDNFNRVKKVTDPETHFETYTYDTVGNKLSVTDKRSNTTDFVYDKANRLTSTKLPEITCYDTGDGTGEAVRPETTTVYLKNGWVASVTDANSNTSSIEYDDAGRKTRVTNAESEVTEYTYDKAGNILTQIVRNGGDYSGDQTTAYTYDKRNLLLTETLMPGSQTLERVTSYTYDDIGNKATRKLPDTKVTTYTYDALNRLTNEAYTGATGENRTYKYNLNGAVTEAVDASGKTLYVYDALGRITSEEKKDLSDTSLSVVSNVYDKAGNRTQVTYPGDKVLSFAYDKRNLLSKVIDVNSESGESDITTYSYDENGNRIGLTLPNGVVTTTAFDKANRVTQLKNEDASQSNIYTTDYRMDKVGNRLKIIEARPSGTRNLIYTYDNVYRLLSEDDDGVVTAYTYDDAGNRLTKSDGNTTSTYTVDQLNRVTSFTDGSDTTSYTYDPNGNRITKVSGGDTHNYIYDRENRLVSVNDGNGTTIFSSVYDYRTRRITKVENGTTVHYVYDGGVNVQELDSARSLTKQLVRGTGMGGGIGSVLYTLGNSSSKGQGGGKGKKKGIVKGKANPPGLAAQNEYFVYNAIGSVVALTNPNGAVTSTSDYEAFGKEVRTSGRTDETRKFCTKERSESIGLDNFGHRYYDADLGRFITRDPSGYPDGPNNYLYCHNNPINHIDPLGLESDADEAMQKYKEAKGARIFSNNTEGKLSLYRVDEKGNVFTTKTSGKGNPYWSELKPKTELAKRIKGIRDKHLEMFKKMTDAEYKQRIKEFEKGFKTADKTTRNKFAKAVSTGREAMFNSFALVTDLINFKADSDRLANAIYSEDSSALDVAYESSRTARHGTSAIVSGLTLVGNQAAKRISPWMLVITTPESVYDITMASKESVGLANDAFNAWQSHTNTFLTSRLKVMEDRMNRATGGKGIKELNEQMKKMENMTPFELNKYLRGID